MVLATVRCLRLIRRILIVMITSTVSMTESVLLIASNGNNINDVIGITITLTAIMFLFGLGLWLGSNGIRLE